MGGGGQGVRVFGILLNRPQKPVAEFEIVGNSQIPPHKIQKQMPSAPKYRDVSRKIYRLDFREMS